MAATLVTKLAHRSPPLADDLAGPVDIAEQERAWEARKAAEKARESCIDGIALQQPALALAEKVISRARKAGLPDELVPDELWVVRLGGDTSAEDELRKATLRFVARIRAAESAAHAGRGRMGRTRRWTRGGPTGVVDPGSFRETVVMTRDSAVRVEFDRDVHPDLAEELVVVADDDHRAAVAVERLGELLDAGDVEVVRRLVEDQQLCGWLSQ